MPIDLVVLCAFESSWHNRVPASCKAFTAFCLLLTAYCLLPTAYYSRVHVHSLREELHRVAHIQRFTHDEGLAVLDADQRPEKSLP